LLPSGKADVARVNFPDPAAVAAVQDAKARFSELLDASLTSGPQIVTRRGEEMAVLVPVDHWRQLEESTRHRLKDLLLAAAPRADIPATPRQAGRDHEPSLF
jgi:prevent-host-death family protein